MRESDVERSGDPADSKQEHRRSFIKTTSIIAASSMATGAVAAAQTGQEKTQKPGEARTSQPPKGFGVAKVVKLTENNLLVAEITAGLPEKFDVHVSIRPRKREGEAAGAPVEGCVFECGIDI